MIKVNRLRRRTIVVMVTLLIGATTSACSTGPSSQPDAARPTSSAAATVDTASIGRLAASRACATTEDAAKLRVAIAIDTLAGKQVAQERFQKLVATAIAAEGFATQAAQNDDRWLTLSRAAAGLAAAPIDPTPGDGYSAVAKECSAQGLG